MTILCSCSDSPEKHADTVISTHYYGLSEYSWPVNYLNAIRDSDISGDLKEIKSMGFNNVILLASWSEFEPRIGKSNDEAYNKINKIITAADSLGLTVMLRIPYEWALDGVEVKDRIAYALIHYGKYREELFSFLEDFEGKVMVKHKNIISRFGSWEDFNVLQELFFLDKGVASKRVRSAFHDDTGVEPSQVNKNGKNYDIFLGWVDGRIFDLIRDMPHYGYEIRIDSDPVYQGDSLIWYSHRDYYKNVTGGDVVVYWAPFYGQKNNGEVITADQAINSFRWMLDLIAERTSQAPFVDQLNFIDNTPGFEHNARLGEGEYDSFFAKLSGLLLERTKGYSLWTIRDYNHNVIYNPAFSEGLKGWSSRDVALHADKGVCIHSGGVLSRKINVFDFQLLSSTDAMLKVKLLSGNAKVDVSSIGSYVLSGKGVHAIPFQLPAARDVTIAVQPLTAADSVCVDWVGLFGHQSAGGALDASGQKSGIYSVICRFNAALAQKGDPTWPGSRQPDAHVQPAK